MYRVRANQSTRKAGGDGVEAEGVLRMALACDINSELAVVDVVPDEFVECPGVQRFITGFVGQQVVRAQVLQAIGQFEGRVGDRRGVRCGRTFGHWAALGGFAGGLNDGDIKQLAAQRQLLFEFDPPGGTFEYLHQRDTEKPLPLAQALGAVFAGAVGGHAASIAANSHCLRRVGATENRA